LNVMLLPVTAGPFGVNIVTTISCVLASVAAVVVAYWVIVIVLAVRSAGTVTLPVRAAGSATEYFIVTRHAVGSVVQAGNVIVEAAVPRV
jgi:high-affinity Fe2+/Pb2+ permease